MELKAFLRSGLLLMVFLIFALHFRSVQAQINTYGDPAYCLFSRLEEVPCIFRFPARAMRPVYNEFGEYSTKITTRAGAGQPKCEILNRRQRVNKIPNFPRDDKVKFIFSPGRRLVPPARYGHQIYVLYNISCPEEHLAFFNLTEIEMEKPACYNINNNQTQCVDYIRVIREGYGFTESCGGDDPGDNQNQLEQGKFTVILRTNDRNRFLGFQATVVCFNPNLEADELTENTCTRPGEESMTAVNTSDSSSTRRKRDLEEFHNRWKTHLAHLRRRRRRQADPKEIRFQTINVPFGVDVFYMNKILRFQLRDGGMPPEDLMPIDNILLINTFDTNGTTSFFIGQAVEDGRELALQGPGPLTIVGNYAYFQLFVIDPRGILPTPEEMLVISNLTEAQYALVTEDNSTRRSNEFLEPPCVDPVKDLNYPPLSGVTLSPECLSRAKRQSDLDVQSSDMLTNETVIIAIQNENACNPVLRTTARSIVSLIREENTARLDELRAIASPSTTASPTT